MWVCRRVCVCVSCFCVRFTGEAHPVGYCLDILLSGDKGRRMITENPLVRHIATYFGLIQTCWGCFGGQPQNPATWGGAAVGQPKVPVVELAVAGDLDPTLSGPKCEHN